MLSAPWGWFVAFSALAGAAVFLYFTVRQWLRLQRLVRQVALEWQVTLDAVDSPIVALDREQRVVRLNRAARRLAGRPWEDLLGRHIDEIGSGEPWRAAAEKLGWVGSRDETQAARVWIAETRENWEVTVRPARASSRARPAFIVVARNISQLVALQESVRRQEVMSRLGSLVGAVAHEVRNPLFAISAVLDAWEERFGADPEQRGYLSILRGEQERLSALMTALLQYGKPARAEREPILLARVIDDVRGACAGLARERGVEVEQRLGAALPEVLMDRERLALAFRNLLENAVQHSPGGSKVVVEARQRDGGVECRVRDAGPGFRGEDLPHLFEPFYSRRPGGTGLGLAIAQRAVEEHGGEIVAGNHPEGGGEVRVRLPLAGKAGG